MSTPNKVPPSHPDIGLTGRKIIYDENGKPYVFFNDSSITNTITLVGALYSRSVFPQVHDGGMLDPVTRILTMNTFFRLFFFFWETDVVRAILFWTTSSPLAS